MNYSVLFGAAIVPLFIGFVYYNPSVVGNAWMKASGVPMPEEKPSAIIMLKIFVQVYLFSLLYSWILANLCIHQMGVFGMVGGDIVHAKESYAAFMQDYGHAFQTFKHGALHGGFSSFFAALFFVGIPALFESKNWKYILIHTVYFTICGLIMGGIICQYLPQ